MPSWTEILNALTSLPTDEERNAQLISETRRYMDLLSKKRNGSNIIVYASSFLQKPTIQPYLTQLTSEEINGFMAVMRGMDWEKGLTLVLHTPGGSINAAETIVSYLHQKFQNIEVIIPTFAMSAGTMISLASNKIIMGRQSQLGPIDPQMTINGRYMSARSIVDQFDQAKTEITTNTTLAHAWVPILQTIGPALIQEAINALEYGERMVANWLMARMCSDRQEKAAAIAKHFNDAGEHKSHGRRIDRDEAALIGLNIESLEDDPKLQDIVLSLYHLITIGFEKGPAAKMILSNNDNLSWVKNE